MNFSKLKDRIVFLKPDYHFENSVGETVPAWVPFSPYKPSLSDNPPVLTLTEGENEVRFYPGKTEADLEKFKVWASVVPTSGREYEEMQKIRAELTYKIRLRYVDQIENDFKILFRDKVFSIESIIDLNGAGREVELIAFEKVSEEYNG